MYKKCIKPTFDILFAVLGIIVLALPMLIIAVAIKIDDPGPVIFKQQRFGKNKKLFWLYKFRTMKLGTPDVPTHLLSNPEQYISKVGRFLRKTSMDELLQLFNILKLDMSLIGPRPALWSQEDLMAERDKYGANDIRPGITGWAQVNGRDELAIPVKAALDGEYVAKFSFLFDVKCMLRTVKIVLMRTGFIEGKHDNFSCMDEEVVEAE